MIVVDASVLAQAVIDGSTRGREYRSHLRDHRLAAPDLANIEIVSVLRRYATSGALSAPAAARAFSDLTDLPIAVFPSKPLLRRCWELRANLTAYDATYVALAEALGCAVLTADTRLANAPGTRCSIELI